MDIKRPVCTHRNIGGQVTLMDRQVYVDLTLENLITIDYPHPWTYVWNLVPLQVCQRRIHVTDRRYDDQPGACLAYLIALSLSGNDQLFPGEQ